MDDKYYNNIKQYLIENESTKLAKEYSKNKNDLNTNFEVGRELTLAGKHYGESIINKYSIKLSDELGKGYTPTRLRYYRRFFVVFSKCPTLSDKLSYSHYCKIIWLSENEINYYIKVSKIAKNMKLFLKKYYKINIRRYRNIYERIR